MNNQLSSQQNRKSLLNIILASFFLALGIVLPFLTGNVQFLGSRFLPMHIPVLLCGYICNWKYGAVVGFITPLLRSVLVGMPPLFPVSFVMAFELATYGLVAGLLFRLLKKNIVSIYVTLIIAMLAGRMVWGIVSLVVLSALGVEFTFALFLGGAFISALPGIIFQIIFIPAFITLMLKNEVLAPYLS